ncbi:adipocyte plasma membrane-associated protein isoform X1 [Rattus norvegicus]|uniref:Adipocyte plasma membrane-associated protein n=1 Tax=Rattus norvegicus TaxID=10116 RepID=A0A8I5ZUF8_RAT|nr:adipocyte plasma membrane-associated protein isoform X2 [Rattus rattus]|eukprot:XP_017447441.1 PREDICTED: adipocyte plasma membrane-associated protein isoform X2 [Rattus norvegicus]
MLGLLSAKILLLHLLPLRSRSFSGRVFRMTFLMLAVSLAIPLLGAMMLLESPIDPQSFSFKEPPFMFGVLQPNTKLRQAERLFENQLNGPESIVNIGDVLFTGTADGRVVKLENGEIETIARFGSGPCKTRDDEPTCGRPLGIRVGPNGTLFVVDAYKGLFEVNPQKRSVKLLLSSETPIEGKKMSFVNDLTITRDGRKIYFTDSSSKWQRRDYLLLVMEGTDDGRLLEYDTVTKEVKVLLDQLQFPNGVQLSPEEDFVLVAETAMARIRRVYVSGLMKGGADMFVENMPGFPDNIRPSSSGGYWVAAATIRANPGFSMLDFLSDKPFIKRMIFKLFSQETVMKFVPRYSLVLEVSDSGAFRRSLHDPDGQVVTYVSEAHEHDGYLYLGSFRSPFICRLSLQSI